MVDKRVCKNMKKEDRQKNTNKTHKTNFYSERIADNLHDKKNINKKQDIKVQEVFRRLDNEKYKERYVETQNEQESDNKKDGELYIDNYFMQKAIEISILGHPSPNPYVGAVIVKDNKIIAQGYHKKAGMAHAEVEAILDAKNKYDKNAEKMLEGSTLYVSLEPCNHTGRTPPCTDAIIKAKIKKVVYAMDDPNKNVRGGGAKYLQEQAQAVNSAYLKILRKKIPLLTLKMACTLDGKTVLDEDTAQKENTMCDEKCEQKKIAPNKHDDQNDRQNIQDDKYTKKKKWVSCEYSRKLVMKMRDKTDAIIIGANTAIIDNPRLTARGYENDPLRVIVDSKLKCPTDLNVFADSNALVAYCDANKNNIDEFEKKKIRLIKCPKNISGKVDLKYLLEKLAKMNINQILCEGGATLARNLLELDLIDVMILFYAPKFAPDSKNLLFSQDKTTNGNIEKHMKNAHIINVMKCDSDLMIVLSLR